MEGRGGEDRRGMDRGRTGEVSLSHEDYTTVSIMLSLNQPLKGQCHEMLVEVRPWSGSLALN
jgi:hypothetical protein